MRKALAAALCLVLLAASGTALAEKTVTLTFVGDCTLGGEDWRVTSTISMAYSCMEEPSAVSFGSSHGSNASFRFALHENIVCRKRRFE